MIQFIRKMLIGTITTAITCYIGVVCIMYLLQDNLLFAAPSAVNIDLPPHSNQVEIQSADGALLKAIYFPAEPDADQVLFFHGNASSAVHEYQRGMLLNKAGFGVLLAEYPGYWDSSGTPNIESLKAAAIDSYGWLKNHSGGDIHVYGQSLGTGFALHVASKSAVKSIVLEAPYNSLMEVAAFHYRWLPVKLLFKNELDARIIAENVDVPSLLIHGKQDRIIPIEFGKKLYRAMSGSPSWHEIEAAGHNDLGAHGSIELAIGFFKSGG